MAYRRYLKTNPFEAAKRNLDYKLNKIQQQILKKFAQGQPRQIMRRTIRQLLQGQTSTQGKIRQLIAIVDHYDCQNIEATDYTDVPDRRSDMSTVGKRIGREDIDYIREQQQRRRSNLYSPLTASQKMAKSFQDNYRYQTQNQEQGSDLSYIPSHNTPFSQLGSIKNSEAPYMSEKSLKYVKNQPLYDSINEKDIFSFRTQKDEQSPIINKSKIKPQSPITHINITNNQSKSKSNKSSINNSRKSSMSRCNNSVISSKSKKNIDYDGVSEVYEPDIINKSLKHRSSSPKSSKKYIIPPSNRQQLYQKILNRLKFSSCVINKIDHSNRSSNIFLLQNRFKLQRQKQASLISDIMRQTQQSSIWK